MKLNVIIIDDCPIQLAIATKLVALNDNLNLLGAYLNPFMGLNAVNNSEVDMVLLDVEMPEIDGFSLHKLIAKPVEVVMNSTRAIFQIQAYMNGAIDFLQKPLNIKKLDGAVLRVLEMKRILAFEGVFNKVAI